jgi:hypothetical protein
MPDSVTAPMAPRSASATGATGATARAEAVRPREVASTSAVPARTRRIAAAPTAPTECAAIHRARRTANHVSSTKIVAAKPAPAERAQPSTRHARRSAMRAPRTATAVRIFVRAARASHPRFAVNPATLAQRVPIAARASATQRRGRRSERARLRRPAGPRTAVCKTDSSAGAPVPQAPEPSRAAYPHAGDRVAAVRALHGAQPARSYANP